MAMAVTVDVTVYFSMLHCMQWWVKNVIYKSIGIFEKWRYGDAGGINTVFKSANFFKLTLDLLVRKNSFANFS